MARLRAGEVQLGVYISQLGVDQAPLLVQDIDDAELPQAVGFTYYGQILFTLANNTGSENRHGATCSFPLTVGSLNFQCDTRLEIFPLQRGSGFP